MVNNTIAAENIAIFTGTSLGYCVSADSAKTPTRQAKVVNRAGAGTARAGRRRSHFRETGIGAGRSRRTSSGLLRFGGRRLHLELGREARADVLQEHLRRRFVVGRELPLGALRIERRDEVLV